MLFQKEIQKQYYRFSHVVNIHEINNVGTITAYINSAVISYKGATHITEKVSGSTLDFVLRKISIGIQYLENFLCKTLMLPQPNEAVPDTWKLPEVFVLRGSTLGH